MKTIFLIGAMHHSNLALIAKIQDIKKAILKESLKSEVFCVYLDVEKNDYTILSCGNYIIPTYFGQKAFQKRMICFLVDDPDTFYKLVYRLRLSEMKAWEKKNQESIEERMHPNTNINTNSRRTENVSRVGNHLEAHTSEYKGFAQEDSKENLLIEDKKAVEVCCNEPQISKGGTQVSNEESLISKEKSKMSNDQTQLSNKATLDSFVEYVMSCASKKKVISFPLVDFQESSEVSNDSAPTDSCETSADINGEFYANTINQDQDADCQEESKSNVVANEESEVSKAEDINDVASDIEALGTDTAKIADKSDNMNQKYLEELTSEDVSNTMINSNESSQEEMGREKMDNEEDSDNEDDCENTVASDDQVGVGSDYVPDDNSNEDDQGGEHISKENPEVDKQVEGNISSDTLEENQIEDNMFKDYPDEDILIEDNMPNDDPNQDILIEDNVSYDTLEANQIEENISDATLEDNPIEENISDATPDDDNQVEDNMSDDNPNDNPIEDNIAHDNATDNQLTEDEAFALEANEVTRETDNSIVADYDLGQCPSVESVAKSKEEVLSSEEGEPTTAVELPIKRKRGRPKGSKNKPKVAPIMPDMSESSSETSSTVEEGVSSTTNEDQPKPKRRPGRPKGSKNKPKVAPIMPDMSESSSETSSTVEEGVPSTTNEDQPKPKRRPGRPKGAKNKPKNIVREETLPDVSTEPSSPEKEVGLTEYAIGAEIIPVAEVVDNQSASDYIMENNIEEYNNVIGSSDIRDINSQDLQEVETSTYEPELNQEDFLLEERDVEDREELEGEESKLEDFELEELELKEYMHEEPEECELKEHAHEVPDGEESKFEDLVLEELDLKEHTLEEPELEELALKEPMLKEHECKESKLEEPDDLSQNIMSANVLNENGSSQNERDVDGNQSVCQSSNNNVGDGYQDLESVEDPDNSQDCQLTCEAKVGQVPIATETTGDAVEISDTGDIQNITNIPTAVLSSMDECPTISSTSSTEVSFSEEKGKTEDSEPLTSIESEIQRRRDRFKVNNGSNNKQWHFNGSNADRRRNRKKFLKDRKRNGSHFRGQAKSWQHDHRGSNN